VPVHDESLLLSWLGRLGIVVAYLGLAALKATMPEERCRQCPGRDGRRVLLFVSDCRCSPASSSGLCRRSRHRSDLADSIKEGALGMSSGSSSKAFGARWSSRRLPLLCASDRRGLLIRSFLLMQKVEPGFDSTGVVTAYLPISPRKFHSAETSSPTCTDHGGVGACRACATSR